MRLSALLGTLPEDLAHTAWLRPTPSDDPIVRGITYDSRTVAPGDLFVAVRGSDFDGHQFLAQAAELGAVAFLVEDLATATGEPALEGRNIVEVADARRALAPLGVRFFGEPSSELTSVGITGTNGKTSVAYLTESILSHAGWRVGLVGTLGIRFAGRELRSPNTTPESLDLQRTLRAMRTEGVEAVAMEVSSHGLELGRVHGCRFGVAAFTNLTQDHLDFHGTMDAYLASKARLFRDHLAPGATAVLNVDDPAGEKLCRVADAAGARVLRTSRRADSGAQVSLLRADVRLDGSRAEIALPSGRVEVDSPLVGDFNLENLLVGCAIAEALGIAPDVIADGVARCQQVPGRMEVVRSELPDLPTLVVDYAHTPDAVDKLVRALRPLSQGRIITVFGCGGDRDRAKRPLMAAAVARSSDLAIATSDNPRNEDPLAILADVIPGLEEMQECAADALGRQSGRFAVVADRREAIRRAVAIARPDDTVVLAGKGHEDYQIIGRDKLPFDDREEARRALADRARGELS